MVLAVKLIFYERKETESTWAWILLLLHFPFLGMVLFLLTGQGISKPEQVKCREYTGGFTEDNQVEIFTTGEEKFEAMFRDLNNARKEILLQYYIFREDFLFENIKEILCKKAAEGVQVKILYDRFGSRKIRKSSWRQLRRRGVEVKGYSHKLSCCIPSVLSGINHCNHRKILVVDGYIGYLGGFNVGKEYLGLEPVFGFWRDTHFRMAGGAAGILRNVFLEDWGEDAKPGITSVGKGGSAVQLIAAGPGSASPRIRNAYLRCIINAKEKIWIQTPYFIPDVVLLNALKLALLSGKEVCLMIPCKPDHPFVYWATLYYARELLEMGAKVYRYQKGFLHAKGMIMDREVYCYGTANIDIRSLHLNYEVNAIVYGQEEVEKMCTVFQKDLQDCEQMTLQGSLSKDWKTGIKEQLCRLLSPLL